MATVRLMVNKPWTLYSSVMDAIFSALFLLPVKNVGAKVHIGFSFTVSRVSVQ